MAMNIDDCLLSQAQIDKLEASILNDRLKQLKLWNKTLIMQWPSAFPETESKIVDGKHELQIFFERLQRIGVTKISIDQNQTIIFNSSRDIENTEKDRLVQQSEDFLFKYRMTISQLDTHYQAFLVCF